MWCLWTKILPQEWFELPMCEIAMIFASQDNMQLHAAWISKTILHCTTIHHLLKITDWTKRFYLCCGPNNALNEPWELMKRPSFPRWTITNLLNISARPLSAKDEYSFSTSIVELRRSVTRKTLDPPQISAESRAANIKESLTKFTLKKHSQLFPSGFTPEGKLLK